MTDLKYHRLYEHAVSIRDHKNLISNEVNANLSFYLNMSFYDFLTYFRGRYKNISSNFDKQLYEEVFHGYQNKFDAILRKIRFDKIKSIEICYYKKDTSKNNKGDFRKYQINKESSKLSSCLTYLSRYYNENIISYIKNKLSTETLNQSHKDLYNNILRCIDKFGEERLINLAKMKRINIINMYKNPCVFKELTFGGRSRLNHIIDYNKNFGSIINSFISISWLNRGERIDVPVKFNKDYHGHMSDYHKKSNDYEYKMVFTDKKKIRVVLCKDGKRHYPNDKVNYVGVDVNVKHNLFTLDDGQTFDYNRQLINELLNEYKKIDELKKDNKYEEGRKKKRKINTIRRKIKHSNEEVCVQMIRYMRDRCYDHVIFENLDNSFGKCYVKDKDSQLNFNRLVKSIGLSSLKDMFEHISMKYDISVSKVQAEYTSKGCSVCGCIDDDNRLSQEVFRCVECGVEINADVNAARNIRQRVSVTVLRDKLLKQTKIGNKTFEPFIFNKDKIKDVLLSFQYRQKIVGYMVNV